MTRQKVTLSTPLLGTNRSNKSKGPLFSLRTKTHADMTLPLREANSSHMFIRIQDRILLPSGRPPGMTSIQHSTNCSNLIEITKVHSKSVLKRK